MAVTAAPARKIFRAAEGAGFSHEQAAVYARYLERKVGLGERPVPPEEIVEAARPKRSPIHDAFEWDDPKAAEHWRLAQARHLVNHIVVTAAPDGEADAAPRRAFLSVTAPGAGGVPVRGYMSEREVWRSAETAGQVIGRALDELRGWRDRYSEVSELAPLVEALDGILAEEE